MKIIRGPKRRIRKDEVVPDHGSDETVVSQPVTLETEDTVINLYRSINTLLPDAGQKVTQFIGSKKGEGTSSITRAFALKMVDEFSRSVLLLDADTSDPAQATYFNIHPVVSFEEMLKEEKQVNDGIYRVEDKDLFISVLSRDSSSITRFLDSLKRDTIWKKLEQFDFILVDSPPATLSSDGLALSGLVDGVILVLEAERTRGPVAESVKEKIIQNGGTILGIVMNKRRHHIPEFIYQRL